MSNRITIEELQSYLWNSAVLLRTSIDAGAYKQYIFPLLFFKRICDVYDEEPAAAIEQYGEDVSDFDEDEIHTIYGYGCEKKLLDVLPDHSLVYFHNLAYDGRFLAKYGIKKAIKKIRK